MSDRPEVETVVSADPLTVLRELRDGTVVILVAMLPPDKRDSVVLMKLNDDAFAAMPYPYDAIMGFMFTETLAMLCAHSQQVITVETDEDHEVDMSSVREFVDHAYANRARRESGAMQA